MMVHPVEDVDDSYGIEAQYATYEDEFNKTRIYCGSMLCLGWLHLGVTMFILGIEIIWTVTGNLLVVIAIMHEKHLRVPGNYLIFNLAFADLLVGMLVMPISAIREVSVQWIFGRIICEIHCHLDVLCCTSSILTLLAIAWDRSLAVQNINYVQKRTPKRMLTTIAIVWFVAFCITIPQAIIKYLLQHKYDSTTGHNETLLGETCAVPPDWYYQLYATCCSFYIPLVLIITLYIRIYKTARSTIRKDKFRKAKQPHAKALRAATENVKLLHTTMCTNVAVADVNHLKPHGNNSHHLVTDASNDHLEMGSTPLKDDGFSTVRCTGEIVTEGDNHNHNHNHHHHDHNHNHEHDQDSSRASSDAGEHQHFHQPVSLQASNESRRNGKRKEMSFHHHSPMKRQQSSNSQSKNHRLEQKREKKAARVLLIVTGTFVACWTPFFLTAVITAFCGDACLFDYQPLLLSIVLWLGYTCSAFNPVIYTIFSPDFRHAFQRILHLQRPA